MSSALFLVRSLGVAIGLLSFGVAQAHDPQRDNSWWWDSDWWTQGVIEAPANHAVRTSELSVAHDGIDIPVTVARPDDDRKYPAVLFVHGRRGLDELIKLHVVRLAARGFVVFAPDLFSGRFISKFPIEHDYVLEDDLNAALDALLERTDRLGQRVCTYSHTRGGYMSLKLAVTKERQKDDIACYVSYYPHMQDPNAPEPMQVYRYALEADELEIPVLIFIGEEEQYQRRRPIEMAVSEMQRKGRPARLIIYPGVGRGFDFRPEAVRTFADDLAAKDAIQRAAEFMRGHLTD